MKDLTKGNIYKTFFFFGLPLVLAGVLTQSYDLIDSSIAGKFLGERGLATISSISPLSIFISSMFWGFCVGFSVYIARLFSAQEYAKLKSAFYTCLLMIFILGVVIGAVWGFSSKFDIIMTEVYNVIANVPYVLLISVIVLIMSASFWSMVFALTITGWIAIAYFIRTQVIIIRDREYNLASRCLGTPLARIATKNILPFMTSVIVTLIATEIPSYISYEVFLSYIGMGLSDMSLGKLIESAKSAMVTPGWGFEFWSPIAVASIIAVVLYLVGQNLGDASDPRTHM